MLVLMLSEESNGFGLGTAGMALVVVGGFVLIFAIVLAAVTFCWLV